MLIVIRSWEYLSLHLKRLLNCISFLMAFMSIAIPRFIRILIMYRHIYIPMLP